MMSEKFCLRWNDFESNISSAFREIRDERDFFDVTLACDDDQIVSAHKVIISACSPLFRSMLKRSKHEHPLVYMRGVRYSDLISVLDFMYHGQVSVAQEELNSFLSVVVKGLTQKNESFSERRRNTQESDPKRYKEPSKNNLPNKIPKPSNSQQHFQHQEDDIQEIAHVKTEPPIVSEVGGGGGAVVQEDQYDQIYDEEYADPEYGYDQSLIAAADDGNKGDDENSREGEYFYMDVVKEEPTFRDFMKMQKSEQGSSTSRKIRVNKSAVYSEFVEYSWTCPNTNKVKNGQKCKVPGCGTQISGNRSTNMKNHLAAKHPDVYERVLSKEKAETDAKQEAIHNVYDWRRP